MINEVYMNALIYIYLFIHLFICLFIIHLFGVIMVVRVISYTFQSMEFITLVLVINDP
jgi:hypothetical protein